MTRNVLRGAVVVGILALAVAGVWRLQLPSIRVQTEALGSSALARAVAASWMSGDIGRHAEQVLAPLSDISTLRARALRAGMSCDATLCHYRGRIDYTLSPVPVDGRSARSLQISIWLDLSQTPARVSVRRLELSP